MLTAVTKMNEAEQMWAQAENAAKRLAKLKEVLENTGIREFQNLSFSELMFLDGEMVKYKR